MASRTSAGPWASRRGLAGLLLVLAPALACAAAAGHLDRPGPPGPPRPAPVSADVPEAELDEAPPPLVPAVPRVRVGRASRVGGEGALDEEAARQALGRRVGALADCYGAALDQDPELEARGRATMELDATGAVARVEVSALGLDEEPAACVARALAALRLPPPAGGGLVLAVEIAFRRGP